MDNYVMQSKNDKPKDITFKIEPMIGLDIDIKNDFAVGMEEKPDDLKSEGSDDVNEEEDARAVTLETEYPI